MEKLFEFERLEIEGDLIDFVKNYNVYEKTKELMSKDIKVLRTMFNILKSKDISISELIWFRNGLSKQLNFITEAKVKEEWIAIFNMVMFYRYNDIKQGKKFGILLSKIFINKLSTIINFIFFDEKYLDKYEMMSTDKSPVNDIKHQVELFNSHKLNVNDIIFNLKK